MIATIRFRFWLALYDFAYSIDMPRRPVMRLLRKAAAADYARWDWDRDETIDDGEGPF